LIFKSTNHKLTAIERQEAQYISFDISSKMSIGQMTIGQKRQLAKWVKKWGDSWPKWYL